MRWLSVQPCPNCGGAILQDDSELVCSSCSRRWPAPAPPATKPREPPNRCLVCNMPAPAGQQTCGEPICNETMYARCEYCQAVIIRRTRTGNIRRYCGKACAGAHRSQKKAAQQDAARITAGCRLCGQTIPKPPVPTPERPQPYCSEACQQAARTEQLPPTPRSRPRICPGCEAVFYPKPGPGRKPRYCSQSCSLRHRSQQKQTILET